MKRIQTKTYHSPCGDLLLGSYEGKLCLCDWITEARRIFVSNRLKRALRAEYEDHSSEVIEKATIRLDEYFYHKRTDFDLPLLFIGTEFQQKVWHALLNIPYGKTTSYATLAQQVGMPRAYRAVANANRANALSIFVPCHRVIGANGSLTGYAGGLTAKKFLLDLENAQ